MTDRLVYPQYLTLMASPIDWVAYLANWPNKGDKELSLMNEAQKSRGFLPQSLQLRWLLSGTLGLPREPFYVWRRLSAVPSPTTFWQGKLVLSSTPSIFHYADAPLAYWHAQVDLGVSGSVLARAFNLQNTLISSVSVFGNGTRALMLTGSQIARVELSGVGSLKVQGGFTAAAFVVLKDWSLVEIVGLPVDKASWGATGYNLNAQGLTGALVSPPSAALQRLGRGAPPFGWVPILDTGGAAPTWKGPAHPDYVVQLQKYPMPPVQQMLEALPEAYDHPAFEVEIPIDDPVQQGGGSGGSIGGSTVKLPALGNLLLGASSDGLASLGLGFGTALAEDPRYSERGFDYMITVKHKVLGGEFELADFVIKPGARPIPGQPNNLTAVLQAQVPPTVVDGPWSEAANLRWDRPVPASLQDARVSGYGIGRYAPASSSGQVLLSPYPLTKGWAPFVPIKRDDDPTHTWFNDGYLPAPADPAQRTFRYCVSAADLFGRYSAWRSQDYLFGNEPVPRPAVQKVLLKLDADTISGSTVQGMLEIDFAWDWTWRTPERIEFRGAFVDAPPDPPVPGGFQTESPGGAGGVLFVDFFGVDAPTTIFPNATVTSLDDAPPPAPPAPNVRHYRLHIAQVQVDFGAGDSVPYTVYARGTQHILPGTPSAWTSPATGYADSPIPPIMPTPPEAPIWASLPDASSVSRVTLTWGSAPGAPVEGYAIYSASEAALLHAAGLPEPDLTQGYVARLQTLRTLPVNLVALRHTFRRINDALIQGTSSEVALPRGTSVMMAYVITAISSKNVESAWPSNLMHFFAVAVPSLRIPKAPQLEAKLASGGGAAELRVVLPPGPGVSRVTLHRSRSKMLAGRLDHMGPPASDTSQPGWSLTLAEDGVTLAGATFTDATISSGWDQTWYRAVSWTSDDLLNGAIGARSAPSGAVWVVQPPSIPPEVGNVAADSTLVSSGSLQAVLLGFDCAAPVLATALGPHRLRVVVNSLTPDADGRVPVRIDSRGVGLHEIPALAGVPPIHPVGVCLGEVYRDSSGPLSRYRVWVRRPVGTPDETRFQLWCFITDPLNRTTTVSLEVQWI